ncbi:hypothetical protein, partial [Streptomyces novaecaesareae]|uniref:hypothetical protein n=1 Tax=Streptomyces novaecaesareae TaxID=68244 RepID=UPI00068B4F7F
MADGWPTVELDPVRRLRVLAAAGAGRPLFAERWLAAGFDDVWSVASDLSGELPGLIGGLRSFEVRPAGSGGAGGDRLEGTAVSAIGHRERFEIVLRSGWCLMQSRVLLGGMAAVPEGDGTRFALLASLRVPGAGPVQRFLGGLADRRGEVLLDRLERRIGSGPGSGPGSRADPGAVPPGVPVLREAVEQQQRGSGAPAGLGEVQSDAVGVEVVVPHTGAVSYTHLRAHETG